MASKISSLCCLIILLMLMCHGVFATRSKLQAIEKENNTRREGCRRLLVDSGKASFFLLAKSKVPPSGPSHRGNNAPH